MNQLFEMKMWDMFLMILDNSVNEENEYDFTIINAPLVTMERHPLMLIARSGQEILLRHETTQKLLDLKWQFIPRTIFYSNFLVYCLLITVFGLYSVELTELNFANSESNTGIDEIWTKYNYKSYYHYQFNWNGEKQNYLDSKKFWKLTLFFL